MFSSNYCKTAVFSTAAVVLFVSGCSTLPSDTGPQVVGTYQRQEDSPGEVIAPQPGDDPDLTLRDFYRPWFSYGYCPWCMGRQRRCDGGR